MFRRIGQAVLELSDGQQHPVRASGANLFYFLQFAAIRLRWDLRGFAFSFLTAITTFGFFLQHVHNGLHKLMYLFRKIVNDVDVIDEVQADKTVSVQNCYPAMTVALNSRHGSRSVLNLTQFRSLAEPHTSSYQWRKIRFGSAGPALFRTACLTLASLFLKYVVQVAIAMLCCTYSHHAGQTSVRVRPTVARVCRGLGRRGWRH